MAGRILDLNLRNGSAPKADIAGVRLGKLVGFAEPDGVYVELESGAEPIAARLCLDWEAERLTQAVNDGRSAVIAFENGDLSRPLVIGVVNPVRAVSLVESEPAPLVIEADADGRRIRVQAHDEIVLQCGDSSISLKRNGRIVIRGNYVETHASGTNRIKGGDVRIN